MWQLHIDGICQSFEIIKTPRESGAAQSSIEEIKGIPGDVYLTIGPDEYINRGPFFRILIFDQIIVARKQRPQKNMLQRSRLCCCIALPTVRTVQCCERQMDFFPTKSRLCLFLSLTEQFPDQLRLTKICIMQFCFQEADFFLKRSVVFG